VASLIAYLKETGDEDFLKEEISFYGKSSSSATVLEHLKRSLAYSKSHTGAHGLPLLGFADWNDCVNLAGKSESMFNACLYGYALLEMIELCDHLGLEAEARQYREDHAAMAQTVNQCWDGDWYIRYYREDGSPIGSKNNEKGSLFTNAQSWPVMAGFAPAERAARALDSVRERHQTRFGIMLSSPGYDEYDPAIGGVTTYPPGAKENGGIFLHSNPWVMIAETKLGRGDRAFEYYCQINPAKRLEDIELYEVEPYCYAQNILGKEHPQFGLGRNSWLSGTASWMYHAASKYILGIRPALDGLIIDPCIPSEWGEFKVTRKSRGASYQITVKNPNGVNRGVTKMTVDGEEVTVGTIAWKPTGTTCRIEVVLG
jgi:cellobiose phosphorylase